MIAPKQLAEALDRLDPRDRELLSLSLRRRVPDDALAEVFAVENAEIARRRARAIERLADEMDLQRGEELGAVLKALLEPDTWSEAAAALGEEFAAGAGASSPAARLAAVPSGPALVPVPDEPTPAEPEPEPRETGPKVVPVPTEPVLEMLAAREREAPDPPRRTVLWALVGLGIAALVGAAGVIGATQFGENRTIVERTGGGDDGDVDTRYFEPNQSGPLAAPFPSDPETMTCYSTAYVRRPTVLYRKPGGARRVKVSPRTEWGSPRVLGVVRERGDWLGVQAPQLDNGEIGWVRRAGVRLDCARWSLHADLSKRRLLVRRDGETVRKMTRGGGPLGQPHPAGTLHGHRQAEGHRAQRLALRLLRARPQRPPGRPAGVLARGRPPGGARHGRRVEHRPARQPRLPARASRTGQLADPHDPARRADLHPRLNLTRAVASAFF